MQTFTRISAVTLLLAFCIMCCSDEPLWAQRRGGMKSGQSRAGGSGPGTEKLPSLEFDTLPFDMAREQLSRGYLGHDVQLIHNWITDRMVTGKAEKETPGQYTKETGRKAGLPLMGSLDSGSVYAFQFRPTETSYDVQAEALRVYCEMSIILREGTEDKTKKGFRVLYLPQMDNHYTYTDPKGAKIEFEEVKFRDYTLAFENFSEFPAERVILPSVRQAIEKGPKKGAPAGSFDAHPERETLVASLGLTKGEADQLKESARPLILCKLVEPYVTSETIHQTGTSERPREYFARHLYLHVRVLEIWFYDFSTGKVLLRMKQTKTQG